MTTDQARQEAPSRTGVLKVRFAAREGRTRLTGQYRDGVLQVVRPLYLDDTGQAVLTVINSGGGYLGGDRCELDFTLDPGAQVLLATQAATRIYRCPGEPATQHTEVRLGPGSRLEILPDPLIAYQAAAFNQRTTVRMHPSATLVMKEVITPGWSPDGSLFGYDRVHAATYILAESSGSPRLVLADNLFLQPGCEHHASALGPSATHLGSLLVVSPHATDGALDAARAHLDDEMHRLPGLQAAATSAMVPGLAVRVLACSTPVVERVLAGLVDRFRAAWFGQGPVALRKY